RNKSAGVESRIYILAKLDEMIGIICQRAHIASGYIQQEIIVPCTVSESPPRPGIAVNKNDVDLGSWILTKYIDDSESTAVAGTNNRYNLCRQEGYATHHSKSGSW